MICGSASAWPSNVHVQLHWEALQQLVAKVEPQFLCKPHHLQERHRGQSPPPRSPHGSSYGAAVVLKQSAWPKTGQKIGPSSKGSRRIFESHDLQSVHDYVHHDKLCNDIRCGSARRWS